MEQNRGYLSRGAGARPAILMVVAAATLVLGGCAANIPIEYSPTSSMSATGSLTVGDFTYLPAINGQVAPNQLKNTAIGTIKFDKNIDAYYRDGVFKELRFVGVKVDGKNGILTGEIKQFLVDDLGYSVDWTVDTHYVLKDASGTVVYDSDKLTKNHTAKFANAFVAINQQVKDNIEALLKDPAFIKAIN
jgi:hypothetical protein